MKVTCTIMPISDKSRFAYAHVWSVCVITRSLLVTFANECLTFICRKIRKKEGPKKNTWININYRYKHFDFYQTAIGTQQLSNSRKPQFICSFLLLVVLWPYFSIKLLFLSSPCSYYIKHSTYVWIALILHGKASNIQGK